MPNIDVVPCDPRCFYQNSHSVIVVPSNTRDQAESSRFQPSEERTGSQLDLNQANEVAKPSPSSLSLLMNLVQLMQYA